MEIHVDDTLLSVHVNPYFLRLNLSSPVIEDDGASASYDPGAGTLTVTVTKANRGEEFRDLDLLTKLLAPKPPTEPPEIEVLTSYEDVEHDSPDTGDAASELPKYDFVKGRFEFQYCHSSCQLTST